MSAKSIEGLVTNSNERRDLHLEQAFVDATDGAIAVPNTLQRALFPRLSTLDTGLLVTTGPGAGRLEAVFVPVLTGGRSDDQLHRLFIIASDSAALDDYIYRLVPYVRSLTIAREAPITLYVDLPSPFCRKYLPDGGYREGHCNHPLDACVDVAVAPLSSFRSLFFGAGGVHALPGGFDRLGDGNLQSLETRRRDLFYFDEAQGYETEDFRSFLKLVEFLYAEDLDVLIGSTTLPESAKEELSFLESLNVPDALYQPGRSIVFQQTENEDVNAAAVQLVKDKYFASSRVGIVRESSEDASKLYDLLTPLYPILVFKYVSSASLDDRLTTYAQIRELEKEGEGYLLVADSDAFENSDLDVNILITSLCAPELLIRRAGRCNRRGDLTSGEIIVVGDRYVGRPLAEVQARTYVEALRSCKDRTPFDPEHWKAFIV